MHKINIFVSDHYNGMPTKYEKFRSSTVIYQPPTASFLLMSIHITNPHQLVFCIFIHVLCCGYFQISMSVQQAIHVKTVLLVSTKLVDISASAFRDTLEFTAIKVDFMFECIFVPFIRAEFVDKECEVNVYISVLC